MLGKVRSLRRGVVDVTGRTLQWILQRCFIRWYCFTSPGSASFCWLRGGFGGLVVSMLACGTQDCGFEPKPSDFSGEKIHSMPSFGGEIKSSVPCRRFAAVKNPTMYVEVWIAGQIDRPFLAQFRPLLTEVSHVTWSASGDDWRN
jgi:hypothetical protein